MSGKVVRNLVVKEFEEEMFAGTIFESFQFIQYEPYVPQKGVVRFDSDVFGLIASIHRPGYDSRPRKTDGTADLRFTNNGSTAGSVNFEIWDLIAILEKALEDEDCSDMPGYFGRRLFQGVGRNGSKVKNAGFLIAIPVLPAYFSGSFESLRVARDCLERLAIEAGETRP